MPIIKLTKVLYTRPPLRQYKGKVIYDDWCAIGQRVEIDGREKENLKLLPIKGFDGYMLPLAPDVFPDGPLFNPYKINPDDWIFEDD